MGKMRHSRREPCYLISRYVVMPGRWPRSVAFGDRVLKKRLFQDRSCECRSQRGQLITGLILGFVSPWRVEVPICQLMKRKCHNTFIRSQPKLRGTLFNRTLRKWPSRFDRALANPRASSVQSFPCISLLSPKTFFAMMTCA